MEVNDKHLKDAHERNDVIAGNEKDSKKLEKIEPNPSNWVKVQLAEKEPNESIIALFKDFHEFRYLSKSSLHLAHQRTIERANSIRQWLSEPETALKLSGIKNYLNVKKQSRATAKQEPDLNSSLPSMASKSEISPTPFRSAQSQADKNSYHFLFKILQERQDLSNPNNSKMFSSFFHLQEESLSASLALHKSPGVEGTENPSAVSKCSDWETNWPLLEESDKKKFLSITDIFFKIEKDLFGDIYPDYPDIEYLFLQIFKDKYSLKSERLKQLEAESEQERLLKMARFFHVIFAFSIGDFSIKSLEKRLKIFKTIFEKKIKELKNFFGSSEGIIARYKEACQKKNKEGDAKTGEAGEDPEKNTYAKKNEEEKETKKDDEQKTPDRSENSTEEESFEEHKFTYLLLLDKFFADIRKVMRIKTELFYGELITKHCSSINFYKLFFRFFSRRLAKKPATAKPEEESNVPTALTDKFRYPDVSFYRIFDSVYYVLENSTSFFSLLELVQNKSLCFSFKLRNSMEMFLLIIKEKLLSSDESSIKKLSFYHEKNKKAKTPNHPNCLFSKPEKLFVQRVVDSLDSLFVSSTEFPFLVAKIGRPTVTTVTSEEERFRKETVEGFFAFFKKITQMNQKDFLSNSLVKEVEYSFIQYLTADLSVDRATTGFLLESLSCMDFLGSATEAEFDKALFPLLQEKLDQRKAPSLEIEGSKEKMAENSSGRIFNFYRTRKEDGFKILVEAHEPSGQLSSSAESNIFIFGQTKTTLRQIYLAFDNIKLRYSMLKLLNFSLPLRLLQELLPENFCMQLSNQNTNDAPRLTISLITKLYQGRERKIEELSKIFNQGTKSEKLAEHSEILKYTRASNAYMINENRSFFDISEVFSEEYHLKLRFIKTLRELPSSTPEEGVEKDKESSGDITLTLLQEDFDNIYSSCERCLEMSFLSRSAHCPLCHKLYSYRDEPVLISTECLKDLLYKDPVLISDSLDKILPLDFVKSEEDTLLNKIFKMVQVHELSHDFDLTRHNQKKYMEQEEQVMKKSKVIFNSVAASVFLGDNEEREGLAPEVKAQRFLKELQLKLFPIVKAPAYSYQRKNSVLCRLLSRGFVQHVFECHQTSQIIKAIEDYFGDNFLERAKTLERLPVPSVVSLQRSKSLEKEIKKLLDDAKISSSSAYEELNALKSICMELEAATDDEYFMAGTPLSTPKKRSTWIERVKLSSTKKQISLAFKEFISSVYPGLIGTSFNLKSFRSTFKEDPLEGIYMFDSDFCYNESLYTNAFQKKQSAAEIANSASKTYESLLHEQKYCSVCSGFSDVSEMTVCSSCHLSTHAGCLDVEPSRKIVGDWWCQTCCPPLGSHVSRYSSGIVTRLEKRRREAVKQEESSESDSEEKSKEKKAALTSNKKVRKSIVEEETTDSGEWQDDIKSGDEIEKDSGLEESSDTFDLEKDD